MSSTSRNCVDYCQERGPRTGAEREVVVSPAAVVLFGVDDPPNTSAQVVNIRTAWVSR